MESSSLHYRSYLLRLWFSEDGETWRAMLEDVSEHECRVFTDLESLSVFLREQTTPGERTARPYEVSRADFTTEAQRYEERREN